MKSITLTPPADYLLSRDVCSYGYFLLDPNDWNPASRVFTSTIEIDGRAVTVGVRQSANRPGSALSVACHRSLSAAQRRAVGAVLSRMLCLEDSAAALAEFHRLDPRFKRSGRGRLMRSPTLFEDIIKTVTSCNVTWPSTITMNRRLCEVFGARSASGRHAFPTPVRLARARPASLRARCSVGYRDGRIVELARMFVRGEIDPAWYQDPGTPDQAVHDALIELPGVGPYAAANIMQLLGRYSRLPLDTESVRHGKSVLGFKGSSAQIMKRVHRHFEPMGEHKFRSYWFELWSFYERKQGPAWTWQRETTGKAFTASRLADKDWTPLPESFKGNKSKGG